MSAAKIRANDQRARERQRAQRMAQRAEAVQAENESLRARHKKLVKALKKWSEEVAPIAPAPMAALRTVLAELDAED